MKTECKFSKVFEKWTPIRFVNNEPFNKVHIEELEEKIKNIP
jgi:hypothetical protein